MQQYASYKKYSSLRYPRCHILRLKEHRQEALEEGQPDSRNGLLTQAPETLPLTHLQKSVSDRISFYAESQWGKNFV